MDFTPGIVDMTFNGLDGWNRPQTTVAKQLASYVVIYSPIQMAADLPENYQQHPVALEFIESVVTDWEQSVALAGEVGEFVVQARQERDGQRWFVGGMTNENSRSLALPLSFLLDDQTYTLTLYRDGAATDWRTNPAELIKESFTVRRGSILEINMVASGGFAAILTPQ
jgi:alpha-glucosidase